MATLTKEEIAYTPVISRDSVTETKRGPVNRLQLALCIVLAINIIIQFIAIVTPGWSIFDQGTVSAYGSVFYATACINNHGNESVSECKTMSFRDTFYADYSNARDERKPALVRTYNLVVRYQMNIQIVWLLTVGTLIFQIFRLTRPDEKFPRLTVINVVALACACPLMYQVLFKNFVDIDYMRRTSEFITGDVGFPYSFFFYIFTFVMTVSSLILIIKQALDHIRENERIHAEMKVKFDRLNLEYEAEKEAYKRLKQNSHLRPQSASRRSRNDERASHSPRHSRELGDHGKAKLDGSQGYRRETSPRRPDHNPRSRDRSPRPRNRSPPREHSYRDHSPRHSPRPRNRSPQREDRRNYSPRSHSPPGDDRRNHSSRNRSPPRQDRENRPSRNRSPPREERGNHSPRNRSPPRDDREYQSSQNRSPPREDHGDSSQLNSREHDNPALVVTPPLDEHSEKESKLADTSPTPLVEGMEENGTKDGDIELSIARI